MWTPLRSRNAPSNQVAAAGSATQSKRHPYQLACVRSLPDWLRLVSALSLPNGDHIRDVYHKKCMKFQTVVNFEGRVK